MCESDQLFTTRIFRGHKDVITCIDIHVKQNNDTTNTPNEYIQLITGSDDDTIRIWSIKTGKANKCLSSSSHIHESIESIAIYDSFVYCAHGSSLSIFDINNNNILITQASLFIQNLCDDDINSINLSPDGKFLAVSDDNGHTKLFNRLLVEPKLELNTSHSSIVGSVAFRPPIISKCSTTYSPNVLLNKESSCHETTSNYNDDDDNCNITTNIITTTTAAATTNSDKNWKQSNINNTQATQTLPYSLTRTNDIATGGFDCQVILSDIINGHMKSSMNFSHMKNSNTTMSGQASQDCQQLLNPPFIQALGYIHVGHYKQQILVCALGDGSIRLLAADNAAVVLGEHHSAHNGMITCMSTITDMMNDGHNHTSYNNTIDDNTSTSASNDTINTNDDDVGASASGMFITGGVDRAIRVWTVVYNGHLRANNSNNNNNNNNSSSTDSSINNSSSTDTSSNNHSSIDSSSNSSTDSNSNSNDNNNDSDNTLETSLNRININHSSSSSSASSTDTVMTVKPVLTKLQKKKINLKAKQKQLKAQQSSSSSSLYEIKLLYTIHHGEKINAMKAVVVKHAMISSSSSSSPTAVIGEILNTKGSSNINDNTTTNNNNSGNINDNTCCNNGSNNNSSNTNNNSINSNPNNYNCCSNSDSNHHNSNTCNTSDDYIAPSLLSSSSSLTIFVADAVNHDLYVYSADLARLSKEE